MMEQIGLNEAEQQQMSLINMQYLEQIPDSIKVATATTPTVMTFMGMPVEQWMFVGSIIVSLMFIVEKTPMMITRIKQLIDWIKNVKRKKQ